MTITRRFRIEKHEEFGMMGMRPLWLRDADPYTGMAVAHDILEHFPVEPGPVEGEFMALGAAFYIRGEGGYWSYFMPENRNSPEKHLASDIPDIIARVRNGDQSLGTTPRTLPLSADIESSINEILNEAGKELVDREMERLTAVERMAFAAWFRRGYRGAARRYGVDAYSLAHLFREIELKADKILEREGKDLNGTDIDFRVNTARGTFTVETEFDRYTGEE
jgi:hypothetical protein